MPESKLSACRYGPITASLLLEADVGSAVPRVAESVLQHVLDVLHLDAGEEAATAAVQEVMPVLRALEMRHPQQVRLTPAHDPVTVPVRPLSFQ